MRKIVGMMLVLAGQAMLLCEPVHCEADQMKYFADLPYLTSYPGAAEISREDDTLMLHNEQLEQYWSVAGGRLSNLALVNRDGGQEVVLDPEPFVILLSDGGFIAASQFVVQGEPQQSELTGDGTASSLAQRFHGWQWAVLLATHDGALTAVWRALLLDGANYIRQELTLTAGDTELPVAEVLLLSGTAPGLRAGGTCDGVPALADGFFMGVEHPMAANQAGVPRVQVGDWQPTQMSWPEHTELSWDLSNHITHAGEYELTFQYTVGGHRLEITRAALVVDGAEIAIDEHFGATGLVDVDNTYRFSVEQLPGSASRNCRLVATVRSDGGTDSTGTLQLADLATAPVLRCSMSPGTALPAGGSLSLSAVCGVAPADQLRRSFQYYLERERANPYRTFLHYNSWYDIGYFDKYDETDCLNVIEAYRRELEDKRGVQLDSFLFDDGWDDYDSLWDFHEGFPSGFTPLAEATRQFGGGIGVWLSPWGGYGEPRERRLKASEQEGYETNEGGFALSGPKYFERFREICLTMVSDYNVNQFKFDGLGRGLSRVPGSRFGSDFEAAVSLISDLRQARPGLFINLTTGTWPSPFWLRYADSIYRGGWDHSFTGVGSDRQQWITYRDAQTYANVVKACPLFPINSLMLHGVIYAERASKLDADPQADLTAELRSYFACGTQLQELYVTPALLTEAQWDELAAAANWARANQPALRDAHWVGGDPQQLEIYGWAGWHPQGGYLALRNPADQPQGIAIDVAKVLELPATVLEAYSGNPVPSALRLIAVYADQRVVELLLKPGEPQLLELQPWEVLVFEIAQ